VCDLEEGDGDQTARATAWLSVVDPVGPPAWLYSGASFLEHQLSGPGHWGSRPLWIAAYGQSNEPGGADAWQYTNGAYSSGQYRPVDFPGIGGGPCDASVFHGDVAAFLDLCGLAGGAPAQQRKGHNMISATSTQKGYWCAKPDGSVFAFGDAQYRGGANAPNDLTQGDTEIIGIAGCGTDGYWLYNSDGSIFAYGSAPYLGRVD
jgi:hypothetical protein